MTVFGGTMIRSIICSFATLSITVLNEGKSAASFCHLKATWVSDMFFNF
jgi:hypothetical protein